ncbi:MAG: hypothetical protein IPN84_01800 [Sphingomonadales bacterium]|nr:hypothetical protein [Sphingomonadales bacterium]
MVATLVFVSSANAQSPADATKTPACELHVWPTSRYCGASFHAGNFRFGGVGTVFDLVLTPKEAAGNKVRSGFGIDRQVQVIAEALKAAGRFHGYTMIVHDPWPSTDMRFSNLLDPAVGRGARATSSQSTCYAELHVAFLTVYKTSLSKKLMSGFLVRDFPANPKADASRILLSNMNRGHEQTGLAKFAFSGELLSNEEVTALEKSFRRLVDQFLLRKKLWG